MPEAGGCRRRSYTAYVTRIKRWLTTTLLAFLAGLALAQTDPVELRLIVHADAHEQEALALLERIVNINSGTMNFEGVREVGQVLGEEFETLGFEVRWVDGAGFDRAGHLVAEWSPEGDGGDRPVVRRRRSAP